MNLIPMLEQNAAHRLTRLIVLQLRSCRLHVLLVRIFFGFRQWFLQWVLG